MSYDVNETQSQGAELLYTLYLRDFLDERGISGYKKAATELIAFDLLSVVYSTANDEFERALYTGAYDGIPDPQGKFADGISADEYDYLYERILSTYEFETGDNYWRNTVTKSPCYYISYAVSMTASLGIFAKAEISGYEKGVEAYLKLFEFPLTEEYENRDVSDVEFMCESAGIGSPFEKGAYALISKALKSVLD